MWYYYFQLTKNNIFDKTKQKKINKQGFIEGVVNQNKEKR